MTTIMQANPHDLARSKREGKAAAVSSASSSPYPNYYAPRSNAEEFVSGLKRQVKFEIGCWPDVLKIHENAPDILAAVWCLMRETLVVCDKVPRPTKEHTAFYAAHLNDCQILQDGHSQLLRASTFDADKIEKMILERRDFDAEVSRKSSSSPRYQLPPGVDTLFSWMLAVHRGNFSRMKLLPFTIQTAPEVIGVILCQYFLSRVCAVYIPKKSSLFKMIQSYKHIQPTDVYMKRTEAPFGESTHPIHRFSFEPAAASLPHEFAFAAPEPHIAQSLTLWSVVMKRSCSEFLSERVMSLLDQILEIAGGIPDMSQPQVAAEILKRIDDHLPAMREKGSAIFVIHLACSRTPTVDRKELTRFERLWTKQEQKERVYGAVVYAAYLHTRELARVISSAVAPEPKILFRDLMVPMSPPSNSTSPVPLLKASPTRTRAGSGDGSAIQNQNKEEGSGTQALVVASSSGRRSSRDRDNPGSASNHNTTPTSRDSSGPTSPRRPITREKDGSPLRSSSGSAILRNERGEHSSPAGGAPVPASASVPLLPEHGTVTPTRRSSGAGIVRTISLSQIEGLDKLDATGHTKPVSLWDKSDIQQWLITIGSKRHLKRFMEADIEGMDLMFLTHEKLESLGVRRKEERDMMLRSLSMMPSSAETASVSATANRSLRGKTSNDRMPTSVSQIFYSPSSARGPKSPDAITASPTVAALPPTASSSPSVPASSAENLKPEKKHTTAVKSSTTRNASPSRRRSISSPVPKQQPDIG